MGDGVISVIPTHLPGFCAAASEQSTEIVGTDQDSRLHRQRHHLLWGRGGEKLLANLWIAVYLVAEVIQRIEKGLRVSDHAA